MRNSMIGLGTLALVTAAPAFAQEVTDPAPAVTVSGGVTVTSDYRFRGLSHSNEHVAVQGSASVNHDSGFYAGVFASSIDDSVSRPGHGDAELDFYAGYAKTFDTGMGLDVGLLYYVYPGAARGVATDFFEPYATLSYAIGPLSAKVGANYAWSGQRAHANRYSLYLRGDVSVSVPNTPLSVLAHVGRTDGQLALLAPRREYTDWSLGVEGVYKSIKAGVQYVDTDITQRLGYADTVGADPTVLAYIGFGF